MNKKFIFGILLLMLLTTFIANKKISINRFEIKKIIIENNEILREKELIQDLSFLYNKNIIFLNTVEIKKKLKQKSFIEGLKIKKIYPSTLKIEIFEKKPIAIIIDENKKFFLGKNNDLINYREISKHNNLPIIYGDRKKFKILFDDLKRINFPINLINKYYLYKSNRWDIEMKDKKIIKLHFSNYKKNLENFLKIKDNQNFKKYKIFDYRIENQLILK